jgi:uncharacterized protein YuzE
MKLSYDPRYNIAYISMRGELAEVVSIQVSAELVVDMSPDGSVYGIELLNANEQLGIGAIREFIVVNEATGERADLSQPLREAA